MKRIFIILLYFIILINQISPILAIDLNSNYAYMLDIDKNKVYIDIKSKDKIYPASMTKIVTLMVALEKIDDIYKEVTIVHEDLEGLYEANASVCGFVVGEKVSVEDLLYGVLLPSGADACNALARITYGSNDQFVKAMNDKVKQLDLKNTHFVNVTGLHDDLHYTTCHDMAILLNEALKNNIFKKVFEAREYTTSSNNKTWYSSLKRGGMALNRDTSYISGGKSGFTYEARLTYGASMDIEGHHFIGIVADADYNKSNSHIEDILNLYNYIEDSYDNLTVFAKNEILTEIKINKSKYQKYQYQIDKDIDVYVPKGVNKNDLDFKVSIKEDIVAPISKYDSIGDIEISYNNEVLYDSSVYMNEDINTDLIGLMIYYLPVISISMLCVIFLVVIKKYKTH